MNSEKIKQIERYIQKIFNNNNIQLKKRQQSSDSLEFLIGTITDLYADWWKLRGHDVTHLLKEFHKLFFNSRCDENILLDKFLSAPSSPIRVANPTPFDYENNNYNKKNNEVILENEIAMYNEGGLKQVIKADVQWSKK